MIDVSDIAWKDLSVSICHPSRIQETPFVAFVCCSNFTSKEIEKCLKYTRTSQTSKIRIFQNSNLKKQLDDEWPESIFNHVGSQSASYLLSVL